MRTSSSSIIRSQPGLFRSLFFCGLLALAIPFSIQAQSGRRIPKQPSSPDPKSPAQPEPPVAAPAPEAPRVPILAVKNLPTVGSSSILADNALAGCLEEFKQSVAVQVSSSKDKTRKEASDYAKASKDTYVVLIELEQDLSGTGRPGTDITGGDPRSLCVSYTVFTPGTGKVKAQGRIFQGQSRGPLGRVPNTNANVDYELRICGREVADRVLDTLNLARPQRH